MRYLLPSLLLSVVLSPAAWSAQNTMQPGLWEITTEVDMPGMPMKLPPQTIRHCYTAADLANSENTVPQSGDGNCQVKNYRIEANTASWEIECSGEGAMRGKASMTFSPNSYTGRMDAVMHSPGGNMEMNNHWRARRIGDCQ